MYLGNFSNTLTATQSRLNYYTTSVLRPFFPRQPDLVSWHQKGKPFWVLLEQEMMGVAVASAGPYANHLRLASDR